MDVFLLRIIFFLSVNILCLLYSTFIEKSRRKHYDRIRKEGSDFITETIYLIINIIKYAGVIGILISNAYIFLKP